MKQLNKLDTLANKRDRDGIRQLQKESVDSNNKIEASVISSSSDSGSQTELEGQTNDI